MMKNYKLPVCDRKWWWHLFSIKDFHRNLVWCIC